MKKKEIYFRASDRRGVLWYPRVRIASFKIPHVSLLSLGAFIAYNRGMHDEVNGLPGIVGDDVLATPLPIGDSWFRPAGLILILNCRRRIHQCNHPENINHSSIRLRCGDIVNTFICILTSLHARRDRLLEYSIDHAIEWRCSYSPYSLPLWAIVCLWVGTMRMLSDVDITDRICAGFRDARHDERAP